MIKGIIFFLIIGATIYWFFILRPGRLDFWRIAANYPDDAYDHFMSNPCWKVFDNQLPYNYRNLFPKTEWDGPFRLIIPKLGDKKVYIFGKYPEFENSQNQFIGKYKKKST